MHLILAKYIVNKLCKNMYHRCKMSFQISQVSGWNIQSVPLLNYKDLDTDAKVTMRLISFFLTKTNVQKSTSGNILRSALYRKKHFGIPSMQIEFPMRILKLWSRINPLFLSHNFANYAQSLLIMISLTL